MKTTATNPHRLFAMSLTAVVLASFLGCSAGQSQNAAIDKLEELGGTVIGENTSKGVSYRLNLINTQITDDDLKVVPDIANVELLWLYNTPVTDAGMVHVAKLQQLTNLDLRRTKISDAGLEHLKGLKKLEQLDVSLTDVTSEGVLKFQLANPGCKVTSGGPQNLEAILE